MKKFVSLAVFCSILVAGCATTRNYQPDIDSLNAKLESLENQLSMKNKEIGGLQDQVRSLQDQLQQASRDKRAVERRLDDALMKKKAAASSGYDKVSTSAPAAPRDYAK